MKNRKEKKSPEILLFKYNLSYLVYISHLLLCNKSPPPKKKNLTVLCQQTFFQLIDFEGQESRSGLTEWFLFSFTHEVVIKLLARVAVISRSPNWERRICFQVHSHGSWQAHFIPGCWPKTALAHHIGLSTELLAAWQLA